MRKLPETVLHRALDMVGPVAYGVKPSSAFRIRYGENRPNAIGSKEWILKVKE